MSWVEGVALAAGVRACGRGKEGRGGGGGGAATKECRFQLGREGGKRGKVAFGKGVGAGR